MYVSPEESLANLYEQLPAVKPVLFDLADQLVEAAPEANWNVLISDDTCARLPTYFVRSVLKHAGYNLPTYFVAGSKVLHHKIGSEAYSDYFARIADISGEPTLRPLVFSESVSTGQSMRWLSTHLTPFSSIIETATLVAQHPNLATTTYCASEGKAAAKRISDTFEITPKQSGLAKVVKTAARVTPPVIKRRLSSDMQQTIRGVGRSINSGNNFIGLYVPEDIAQPLVRRNPNNGLTYLAYRAMAELVTEYNSLHADELVFA